MEKYSKQTDDPGKITIQVQYQVTARNMYMYKRVQLPFGRVMFELQQTSVIKAGGDSSISLATCVNVMETQR